MSLDQNLFTLSLIPNADNPQIIDLIDPKETVHYRKERGDRPGSGDPYGFGLFDPLTGSLLATVSAPGASSKHKTIELHNPTVPIELKSTGTFTFRWAFKWEEHQFEWRKEECFLIRKPDPLVLVAITKEASGKVKKRAVQILDYNLNRFDINDRKGLEIVILSALLSFQDHTDDAQQRKRQDDHSSAPLANPALQANIASEPVDASLPVDRAQRNRLPVEPPPPESSLRPPKLGVELIAEMQKGDLSEVVIGKDGRVDDYARYCANLLEADHMLFIVLTSSSSAAVPKVLQVAHETKMLHHRAGSDDELYQYVQYGREASKDRKIRRIIKLDDAEETDKYKPPESLKVHLSKIIMPELQPKAKEKTIKKEKHDKKQQVAGRSRGSYNGQASEGASGKTPEKIKKQKDEKRKSKEGSEMTRNKSEVRFDRAPSPKRGDTRSRLRKQASAFAIRPNAHAHEDYTPGRPFMQSASSHGPMVNMRSAPPTLPPRPPLNTPTAIHGSLRGYSRSAASYGPHAHSSFHPHLYPNTSPIHPQHNPGTLAAGSKPSGFLDKLFR